MNLLLLGAILLLIFNLNFRFEPNSPFFGGATNRIETVARLISDEINEKSREERDGILKKYSEVYKVEFFLFDNQGRQLGGREIILPAEVFEEIAHPEPPMPPSQSNDALPRQRFGGFPPGPPPSTYLRTKNPTLYWFGVRTLIFEKDVGEPIRTRILAVSDSSYGHGLFFDPMPWIVISAVVVIVSILFWFPFVRNITKSVAQISDATEKIAEEDFNVRVSENRTDELGRMGKAVNHLAKRLSGFVSGQKRFLGDISHELNSPLARMQFALSILEDRVDEQNRAYVEDVKEDVELMAQMVGELLEYSKTGIKASQIELEKILLRPIVERVVSRETARENAEIEIAVEENIEVLAQPELLSRALANVIRNAVRYAGNAGKISISAENNGNNQVKISITDNGAGVPESSLEKLFDPFYRIESDRSRQTGGTGLGLAIVKTCVETCQGKVSAQNLTPKGFAVNILLKN